MILASWRDLLWRRKRFAIALVATALVFSMSLVMSGVSQSFPREINHVVSARTVVLVNGPASPDAARYD